MACGSAYCQTRALHLADDYSAINMSYSIEPYDTGSSMRSRTSVRLAEIRRTELRVRELEAELIAEALPEGFRSDSLQEEKPISRYEAPPPSRTYTILNIANGAIWGVLARKGLMVLTDYLGAYLGGVVWANFAACFVMGIAVDSEHLWSRLINDSLPNVQFRAKGAIPLYVGITTGFCGTCSSFSSFILEAFNKAADTLDTAAHYPNHAYGIMEALAVMLAQIAISAMGFQFGRHAIMAVDKQHIPIHIYRLLNLVSSGLGVAAYVIVVVLIATQNTGSWRSWTFSCLFAPWGAVCRFYLSKYLNKLVSGFPMGTFVANLVGCVLLAIFTILARGKRHSNSTVPITTHVISCHVLIGLDDGFCGALTTVSTFIVELFALDTAEAYIYGLTSVAFGFSTMVLLLGSYNWALGLTLAICT